MGRGGKKGRDKKKNLDRMRAGQLDLQRHKREFLRFFCHLVNKWGEPNCAKTICLDQGLKRIA